MLMMSLDISLPVYSSEAVIGALNKQPRELIDVGKYVQFHASPDEVSTIINVLKP